MPTKESSPPLIEKHTIGYIPPEDRHGKTRDLFTLWFGGNIAPLPIVTGALGVQIFHLNLLWGIVAILVGHLVGGALMALHSAQGPQMGIPQMIQSRAQFGSFGSLLVVAIAGVMYVGFFASNIVLAGQSLHGIAPAVGARDWRGGILRDWHYRLPMYSHSQPNRHLGAGHRHYGRLWLHLHASAYRRFLNPRRLFLLGLAGYRVAGGAVADCLRPVCF